MNTEDVDIAQKIDNQIDSTECLEAKNSQNQEKILPTYTSNNNSKTKDENLVTGHSQSGWQSQPKCIINMTLYLQSAKSFSHHIKEDWPLVDIQVLHMVEKHFCQSFWSTSICAKFVVLQNRAS